MNDNVKPLKISGTFMWVFASKVNEMSGKYQFDLCNLSDKAVKALEAAGVSVLHKEDRGYYVTYKSNHPIEIRDEIGDILVSKTGEVNQLVGNGSKGYVVTSFYEWTWKKNKGVSVTARKTYITDLVKYDEGGVIDVDGDEDDEIL